MANERKLVLNIIGDASSLQRAFNQAESSSQTFMGGLSSKIKGALGIAAIGAAAAGVGAAFSSAANKAVDFGKGVVGLQRMTGASAESASGLAVILNRYGIEASASGRLIKGMTADMTNSKGVIAGMGITVKDSSGHYRGYADVIGDISEKFRSSTDIVQRNAEMQKIFGRNWQQMLPILQQGKAGLAELTEKAQQYGLIMTEDNIGAIKKYVAASKDADAASQGLKIQFGLMALPIKQFLAEAGLKFIGWLNDLRPVLEPIGDVIGQVIAKIQGVMAPLISLFDSSTAKTEGFKAAFKTVGDIIDQVVAFAQPLIAQIATFITQQFGVVVSWVQTNWPLIQQTITTVVGVIKAVFDYAFPVIKAVVSTTFEVIKTVVSTVMYVVLGIIKTVMQLITGDWSGAWETLKGVVKTVFKGIGELVENLVSGFIDIGKALVTSLWKGISSMGKWLYEKLKQWALDHIPKPLKDILKIESPSKVMFNMGRSISEGLALGIESGTGRLLSAMGNLSVSMAIPSPSVAMAGAGGQTININIENLHTPDARSFVGEINDIARQASLLKRSAWQSS